MTQDRAPGEPAAWTQPIKPYPLMRDARRAAEERDELAASHDEEVSTRQGADPAVRSERRPAYSPEVAQAEMMLSGHGPGCLHVAHSDHGRRGKGGPLCPYRSDVDLFRYGEGIIDLDSKVTDSALDLIMPQ